MKTIIVYESTHHGNTRKLVDAVAAKCGVETISAENAGSVDLNAYDMIGIASGVAFGKFYEATEKFAAQKMPGGKKVFFIYTCGSDSGKYAGAISATVKSKNCEVLGTYGCRGYDTFGPFKLIGGIAKGHPTTDEIDAAVVFVEKLLRRNV